MRMRSNWLHFPCTAPCGKCCLLLKRIFIGFVILISIRITWLLLHGFDRRLKNWSDRPAMYTTNYVPLRVYVVEEHHEVIPYWVKAVRNIGRHKLSLVHIDAHGDTAMPADSDDYPFGALPELDNEISALMQGNDRFIMGAASALVLDAIYLIFPFWIDSSERYTDLKIGIKYENGHQRRLCACYSDHQTGECEMENEENSMIPRGSCNVMFSLDYAEMGGRKAASRSNELPWIQRSFRNPIRMIHPKIENGVEEYELRAPLIIDIDEDFFGVQLAARPLLDAGLKLQFIINFSSLIKNTFCPQYAQLESEIDAWFRDIIFDVISTCKHNSSITRKGCYQLVKKKHANEFVLRKPDWICKTSEAEPSWRKVLARLTRISITERQLMALARVGICLEEAGATYDSEPTLRLCIGHNRPGDSLVEEFIPDESQFEEMDNQLKSILEALPFPPTLITLCRSSRDGYTPRWMQNKVETVVLSHLKQIFRLNNTDIIFTKALAGGEVGWLKRSPLLE